MRCRVDFQLCACCGAIAATAGETSASSEAMLCSALNIYEVTVLFKIQGDRREILFFSQKSASGSV